MEGLLVPLLVAAAAGSGFLLNEWSQGEFASVMGLGHHHMSDVGDARCSQTHASMHGWAHECGGPWNSTSTDEPEDST